MDGRQIPRWRPPIHTSPPPSLDSSPGVLAIGSPTSSSLGGSVEALVAAALTTSSAMHRNLVNRPYRYVNQTIIGGMAAKEMFHRHRQTVDGYDLEVVGCLVVMVHQGDSHTPNSYGSIFRRSVLP